MRARPFTSVIAALALIAAAPAPAPSQGEVAQCTRGMLPIPDNKLRRSIDELKRMAPELSFRTEEPCGQERATARALTRTLHKDHLKRVVGYELVKILHARGYFTVERFRMAKPNDVRALEVALDQCEPRCKLKIEENTCLRHFVVGEDVVFMVSSAIGCNESIEKLRLIEGLFSSSPERSPGP